MNRPLEVLVDTGATTSAVSTAWLYNIPKCKNLIKRESPKICLSVNSQTLKSIYTVVLPVFLKKNSYIEHEFEVIPHLISPALLGTDFLKKHNVKLDFSNDSVQLYSESFSLSGIDSPSGNILSVIDEKECYERDKL